MDALTTRSVAAPGREGQTAGSDPTQGDGGGAQALTVRTEAAPSLTEGLTQVGGGPVDALTTRSVAAPGREGQTAGSDPTQDGGGLVDALTVWSVAAPGREGQTAGPDPTRVVSLAEGRLGPQSA